MNVLIIGGLLVVAAAAVIGAILLGRSEQQTELTPSIGVSQPASTASDQLKTRKLEDEAVLARPDLPTMRESTTTLVGRMEAREEEQMHASLNGQLHEMANEIRELHQHAWDLEQRLGTLTNMVDHLERVQRDHSSSEGEQSSQ